MTSCLGAFSAAEINWRRHLYGNLRAISMIDEHCECRLHIFQASCYQSVIAYWSICDCQFFAGLSLVDAAVRLCADFERISDLRWQQLFWTNTAESLVSASCVQLRSLCTLRSYFYKSLFHSFCMISVWMVVCVCVYMYACVFMYVFMY